MIDLPNENETPIKTYFFHRREKEMLFFALYAEFYCSFHFA